MIKEILTAILIFAVSIGITIIFYLAINDISYELFIKECDNQFGVNNWTYNSKDSSCFISTTSIQIASYCEKDYTIKKCFNNDMEIPCK